MGNNPDIKQTTRYCDFCGKSQNESRTLIRGPQADICDACVMLCLDVIVDRHHPKEPVVFPGHEPSEETVPHA